MDVVSEAIALLAKHKGYAYGLYTDALGKELAANALTQTAVVAEVFTQIIAQGYSMQDLIDVSRAFLDALSPAQTSQILKDSSGAILLIRVKGFLSCHSEKFKSAARCMKIDAAFGAATGMARAEIKTSSNDSNNGNRTKQSPYYTIDANIVLEAEAIAILDKIGPLYFNKVGKKFNVNSGTRDAYRQADAMWVKYPRDKTFSEYPQRKLINEILEAIKKAQAAGKNNAGIVQAMTNAIQIQINRKEYISKHLIAGCIDIATLQDIPTGVNPMTGSEQKIMMEIAVKATGGTAKKENNPPHIHIQFK